MAARGACRAGAALAVSAALVAGCAGTPGTGERAGGHRPIAGEAPLRSPERFDTAHFAARYDGKTGQCAAGSRQLLSKDELDRLKDGWSEHAPGCTDPRKLEVPPSADYPALLQARRVSGAAHVLVLMDRDGAVHAAHAVCATDERFAEAAEATARAIGYAPSTCAGTPARSAFMLPFNYDI